MLAEVAALGVGTVEVRGLASLWGRRRALASEPARARIKREGLALASLVGSTDGPLVAEGLALLRQLLVALRLEAELPTALCSTPCSTCPERLALLEADGALVRAACALCGAPIGEARQDRASLPVDVLERIPRRARSEAA